ncbi:HAD-like domain-containing protein [Aspergillus varians]
MSLPPTLIIFDFDGTLFNTHISIAETIKETFTALLPSHTPTASSIQSQISSGVGLTDAFRALHPTGETLTPEEAESWISTYRTIYASTGQALITAYPGAQALLQHLKERGIPVAIISNKGVAAVQTALANNGLDGYIPENLIIGDKTPGAVRKPDPASFRDVLVPRLREMGVESGERVVVVGDTVADIQFAGNIGGRCCWCRFGYGDREVCEGLRPEWVVDGLGEVVGVLGGI